MKSTLISCIDEVVGTKTSSTVAHLGIAPGVIETMVTKATLDVPGVAEVGGPKVSRGFTSILTRNSDTNGVAVARDGGSITLDISIQIFYGYKLQDIVDGIRINVADALESQVGITVEAINVYVSAVQFEV